MRWYDSLDEHVAEAIKESDGYFFRLRRDAEWENGRRRRWINSKKKSLRKLVGLWSKLKKWRSNRDWDRSIRYLQDRGLR